MKKIILSLVFVFASLTFANANSNSESPYNSENYSSCLDDAWRYGTENGGGDSREEYDMTLLYFELFC